MWDAEQVWVYQQPCVVSVEGGEHLGDGWDSDLALVEYSPFFSEENTVGDGSVHVSVCIVVQTDYVALGDKVEKNGGQEGEETDHSTESSLYDKAVDS